MINQKPTTKTTDNSSEYEIPIADNFKLNAKKKLGNGAFGEIFYGVNVKMNEEVAIKLESNTAKHPQLFYEAKLYMSFQGGIGIPSIHWCGSQGNFNIMIIDLLGPSLEDLFNYCKRKFTVKTTVMIGDQIVSIYYNFHLIFLLLLIFLYCSFYLFN